MSFCIVQKNTDGTMGRYFEIRPFDQAPTWDATITAHATKFDTYEDAERTLDAMDPDFLDNKYGWVPLIVSCRKPIR